MDRGLHGRRTGGRAVGGPACEDVGGLSLRTLLLFESSLGCCRATIKDATEEGSLSLLLELGPQKSSPGLSFASTPANDPSQGSTPGPSKDTCSRRTQWSGPRAPHPPDHKAGQGVVSTLTCRPSPPPQCPRGSGAQSTGVGAARKCLRSEGRLLRPSGDTGDQASQGGDTSLTYFRTKFIFLIIFHTEFLRKIFN